jgi:ATP-dependent DNA helicase RecG
LVETIKTLLPSNEVIGKAFREEHSMYPEKAIRELVANALIHQDFSLAGTGPMVELFERRMEITNPGRALIDTDRFLNSPPQSRNEALASFMRRINICEERGTGIDKVVSEIEIHQLPAPLFEVTERHTIAVLFGHKPFAKMDKEERIRASYLHCCLCYANREPMNNASLRQRFGIEAENRSMVSRVIKDTVHSALIKPYDVNAGSKAMRYLPSWV